MAKQDVTMWSPDTCDCRIYIKPKPAGGMEYISDDAVRNEQQQRIVALDKTVNPRLAPPAEVCSAHTGLGYKKDKTLFNAIADENGRKNLVLSEIQKIKPEATSDNYNWSFNAQRKLKVGFINMPVSAAEKGQLMAACNTRFGAGKVEVI